MLKSKSIKSLVFFLILFISVPLFSKNKIELLINAVTTESPKELKKILKKSFENINYRYGEDKETPLMIALKNDREYPIIELLLKAGANPEIKNKNGLTSVMYAARYSSSEKVIEKIINHGTIFTFSKRKKLNKKDKFGKTTFDYALENNNSEMVLNILNKYKKTEKQNPLTEEGHIKVSLTEAEEVSDTTDISNESLNDYSQSTTENITTDNSEKILEKTYQEEQSQNQIVLSENDNLKIQIECEDLNNNSSQINTNKDISLEKEKDTLESQKELIPLQDINTKKQKYIFDYAELKTEEYYVDRTSKNNSSYNLIENPNKTDLDGRTLLMKAAKSGDLSKVKDLIYSKANVNMQDKDGWTALMFACRFCNNEKITQYLLNNKADITIKNNYEITALRLASSFNKNPKVVQLLLDEKNVNDFDVISSFIYAVTSESSVEILNLFLKKGININSPYNGKTPLMHAAEYNKSTDTIAWLLKNGAKTTYKTATGMTAFDYAKENKKLPRNDIFWKLNTTSGDF